MSCYLGLAPVCVGQVRSWSAFGDSEAETAIREKLNCRTSLPIDQVTIRDFPSTLARELGIRVDWEYHLFDEVEPATPIDASPLARGGRVADALRQILEPLHVTAVIDSNRLLLTSIEEAGNLTDTRFYCLEDLVLRRAGRFEFRPLVKFVKRSAFADPSMQRDDDGAMVAIEARGRPILCVRDSRRVHAALEALLGQMKSIPAVPLPSGRPFGQPRNPPMPVRMLGSGPPPVRTAIPTGRFTATERAIDQRLEARADFDFKDVPLDQVVRELSSGLGIPVELDLPTLDKAGVPKDLPITGRSANGRLRTTLGLTLGRASLAFTVEEDRLLVSIPERLERTIRTVRYPVDDLVDPHHPRNDLEDIAALAGGLPSAEHGEEKARGNMRFGMNSGRWELVVRDMEGVHREIDGLLSTIRTVSRGATDGIRGGTGESGPRAVPLLQSATIGVPFDTLLDERTAIPPGTYSLTQLADLLTEQWSVDVVLDHARLNDASVSPDEEVEVSGRLASARDSLRVGLGRLGLTWMLLDNVVLLTTDEAYESQTGLVLYSAEGLVPRVGAGFDFSPLVEAIRACIAPNTWKHEFAGFSITPIVAKNCPLLLIEQSSLAHREVRLFLRRLWSFAEPKSSPDASADYGDG
jgi:hypothetical protein